MKRELRIVVDEAEAKAIELLLLKEAEICSVWREPEEQQKAVKLADQVRAEAERLFK